jgi:hypothetical protein
MENFDSSQEWQRLSEYYREISDEELLILAGQYSDLTGVAQQVLSRELSQRGLEMPKKPASPASKRAPVFDPDTDSAYAEDRKLVHIATVWSMRDALQLQGLLEPAGIPFFMGAEKATQADAVSSSFGDGVKVQTMKIGVPWAVAAMKHYAAEDEPETEKGALDGGSIHCPKCLSEDVVIGDPGDEPETSPVSHEKFNWMCVSCNHQWEDDGVETE